MQGARRTGWSLADDAAGNDTETQTASLSGIPLPAPADGDPWNPVPLVCVVASVAASCVCVCVFLVWKRRRIRRRMLAKLEGAERTARMREVNEDVELEDHELLLHGDAAADLVLQEASLSDLVCIMMLTLESGKRDFSQVGEKQAAAVGPGRSSDAICWD
eukprot:Rhum_TRINITY_DN14633_c1_g1::Rhum_TRINITY_DN14633_c1_g1_i2::g.104096::m.104096